MAGIGTVGTAGIDAEPPGWPLKPLRSQHKLGHLFDKQGDPIGVAHDVLHLRLWQPVAPEPLDHLHHLRRRQPGHREQRHVGQATPGRHKRRPAG